MAISGSCEGDRDRLPSDGDLERCGEWERDLSLEADREFLLDPLEDECLLRCFGECDDERLLERDRDLCNLSLEFDLDLE